MEIKRVVVGPLLTNCYILISGNEAILIDPGAEPEKILKEIEGKKLNYIILTHYHWDHTLAVEKIKEKTQAKILIHKNEKNFIKFEVDQFLEGEEEIRIGNEYLKIIHTPGHTSGSICILGENFIFTGDTLFEDGFGRTDLPGGSKEDLKKSLKKLENVIKSKMKIYPGHGDPFEKNEFKLEEIFD
jgi:glyoxylase-like metal-dependent hydrolase (beta-lactamase superfamily II)